MLLQSGLTGVPNTSMLMILCCSINGPVVSLTIIQQFSNADFGTFGADFGTNVDGAFEAPKNFEDS